MYSIFFIMYLLHYFDDDDDDESFPKKRSAVGLKKSEKNMHMVYNN